MTASAPEMPDDPYTNLTPAAAERVAVKFKRAHADPIIKPHPQALLPKPGTPVRRHVLPARIEQVVESPATDPIECVTWPETALYFSMASATNENWARGSEAKMYRYALGHVLDNYDIDTEGTPIEGMDFDVELQLQEERKLRKLRERIRSEQDDRFLDEVYPTLDTEVPKAFWTDK